MGCSFKHVVLTDFIYGDQFLLTGTCVLDRCVTTVYNAFQELCTRFTICCVLMVVVYHSVIVPHYNDVIMDTMASPITSLTIVYSTFYSGVNQRKHQNSVSLAFVCGEFTGDRWIPRTNGQLRGECFHLMTSSCISSTSTELTLGPTIHLPRVSKMTLEGVGESTMEWCCNRKKTTLDIGCAVCVPTYQATCWVTGHRWVGISETPFTLFMISWLKYFDQRLI